MTAPNMATTTASLERSLQNCSLNHQQQQHHSQNGGVLGEGSSSSDDIDAAPEQNQLHQSSSDTTLELNSHVSLPYHWEQCLDLKTGEIYYINWRNGMKAKEDPRMTREYNGDYYSEDDSSYDSEESSSGSSPASSSRDNYYRPRGVDKDNNNNINNRNQVLVVAGCKTCLMYIMVPKQVEDCPKCCGQLLHFDRSQNGSP